MFAVIMAGGSGTRFWPASRKQRPKQFLDITGRGPMVVETCNRLKSIVRDEDTLIILGYRHLEEARSLFSGRRVHLIAEPVGRNTAPCIGLGAVYARYLGREGPVAFLPADHFIADSTSFVNAVAAAGELASSGGIVTLGIVPTRPETGYGYIRRDSFSFEAGPVTAYTVLEFVEKPDLEQALQYISSGEYYWNGGIFVATPKTILTEISKYLPELYAGLQRLSEALGTKSFEQEFKDVYNTIKGISFDYGIMEKTKEMVYVVPSNCGWSDVGSWASLYELRKAEHDNNQNLIEGDSLLIDCRKSFVSALGGRLVACLGLENCLVVDTEDSLLVADINRSQDVRNIVDQLKKTGKEGLL